MERFEEGLYEEAIRAFTEGYALEPRPAFLYALGQSERKRGNCVKALEHYRGFLATHPTERQTEAVLTLIERCERVLAEQNRNAPPATAPEPSVPAKNPEETRGIEARAATGEPWRDAVQTPWYKDWVGGALCGAGLVSAGLGTLFLLQGNGALDGKSTYLQHVAAIGDGESKQTLGTVLLVAGGGLIAGGVVRYLLVGRQSQPAQTIVTPTTLGQGRGFAVAVSGAF